MTECTAHPAHERVYSRPGRSRTGEGCPYRDGFVYKTNKQKLQTSKYPPKKQQQNNNNKQTNKQTHTQKNCWGKTILCPLFLAVCAALSRAAERMSVIYICHSLCKEKTWFVRTRWSFCPSHWKKWNSREKITRGVQTLDLESREVGEGIGGGGVGWRGGYCLLKRRNQCWNQSGLAGVTMHGLGHVHSEVDPDRPCTIRPCPVLCLFVWLAA